jgi:uncharacterized protein
MSFRSRPLSFLVTDLVGQVGARRGFDATVDVAVDLESARVAGPVAVLGELEGMVDGVIASGTAQFDVELRCTRCLTEWTATFETSFLQPFEDGLDEEVPPLGADGTVDLSDVVHDEVSLALPQAPTCRSDCAGLCPTCGTDLNTAPCPGHDDEPSSPFSALGRLLSEP